MKCLPCKLKDVWIIEPYVFIDARGYFFESFNLAHFLDATSLSAVHFVQDNESHSLAGVLRGLHYQVEKPQGKLVRVTEGLVFDVAVDLRKKSPTYGQWEGFYLSAENKKQLWIPPGFAHGFLVLSAQATFQYKVTDYRYAAHERCIRFDDVTLNIQWPTLAADGSPLAMQLSDKDRQGQAFIKASVELVARDQNTERNFQS